jgi:hypothetical protein
MITIRLFYIKFELFSKLNFYYDHLMRGIVTMAGEVELRLAVNFKACIIYH